MNELFTLIKKHKFTGNGSRVNIRPEEESKQYGKSRFLTKRVLSNTLASGDILEACQQMLGPQINRVCINKDLTCFPHRDKNKGLSYIAFFRDYSEGGHLHFEDNTMYDGMQKILSWAV